MTVWVYDMKHLTTVRSSDTYFLTIGNYDITVHVIAKII